jgi:hypothetical protein
MSYPWKGAALPMSPTAFAKAAAAIGCEEAAIRAVWDVEASGRGFASDGSVKMRFEPHHMPGSKLNWRQSLKISTSNRQRMFMEAYRRAPEDALRATSHGGPQIMGLNHEDAGFSSAKEMVETMATGEDAHLDAFVALINSWGIAWTLRAHDWLSFASRYNGTGQAPIYARKIEAAYRRHSGKASPSVLRAGSRGAAVKELQRALGIPDDGVFGPETDKRVRAFQTAEGLIVDGIVGKKTWDAIKAKVPVKPQAQSTQLDDAADKVKKWSGIAALISGATTTVQEFLPAGAFTVLAYGVVFLALVAGLAFLVQHVRKQVNAT